MNLVGGSVSLRVGFEVSKSSDGPSLSLSLPAARESECIISATMSAYVPPCSLAMKIMN